MSEMLIIIDMQPRFNSSFSVIKAVTKEIRRAKKLGLHIMVVEYGDYSKTHQCLLDLIGDYKNQSLTYKEDDGGGYEIHQTMEDENLDTPASFRLVGVNFGACVKRTAEGLAGIFLESTIEVIKKASNPKAFGPHDDGRKYENHANLVIHRS